MIKLILTLDNLSRIINLHKQLWLEGLVANKKEISSTLTISAN